MARPVDPRLWRYARSARRYLIASVGLSLAITAGIVVAALMLARIAAGVITDPGRRTVGMWTAELVVLAVAIAGRVVATWWQSRLAHRAGAQVVAELETSVLAAGAGLPPRELDSRRTELAVVVGDGLAGLRSYLTGYLPALLLAALVPPIVLAVIAAHDLTAAIIILVTLPLIPIFMILIGWMTQGRADAALTATTRLSDQMLDLFAGMPTLRALGRESGAAEPDAPTMRHRVRELGEALRVRTMATLRMAFLSSMVLEMLATLCVALVAVSIGMRLVFGHMGLYAGLLGLILAPEVYLPLRAVGERFHAAQDGMAAAERAFAVLDPESASGNAGERAGTGASEHPGECANTGAPGNAGAGGTADGRAGACATGSAGWRAGTGSSGNAGECADVGTRGDAALPGVARPRGGELIARTTPARLIGPAAFSGSIELCDLGVKSRDGYAPAGLSAVIRSGAVTVLAGANGSGKSTALQAVLGLTAPDRGRVLVAGRPVGELDSADWWARVAWLPQRPVLLPGTLRENLELFGARPDTPDIDRACAATGFDAVLAELPDGWDTVVGTGGLGLSLGQRQRLALVRVLAADRPVLLLDEPTAHLDDRSEATVLAALSERAREGATVIVVAHRPTLLAIADHIVEVHAEHFSANDHDAASGTSPTTQADSAPMGDAERGSQLVVDRQSSGAQRGGAARPEPAGYPNRSGSREQTEYKGDAAERLGEPSRGVAIPERGGAPTAGESTPGVELGAQSVYARTGSETRIPEDEWCRTGKGGRR
ncbi:putative ABC transporter, ATP-binding protein/permease [Nocardia nova SH22a]|uniref:Putative ABC transporter, ATP-binding protein/permease n=1 Tax=Nocardia nova SH22a TaxID=1415166 RepID=W5T8I1_9NOCA|nr:putative ABC transporter, ATP-binding protein/permease [Nocardia nova SH22a]